METISQPQFRRNYIMLRRKSLIAAMLLITMSLEGPSPYTVYAGQTNEPGYVETVSEPNQAFSLSGYMSLNIQSLMKLYFRHLLSLRQIKNPAVM